MTMRGLARTLAFAALTSGVVASGVVAGQVMAPGDSRRSGYEDMGGALRAMQDDDAANPGMLFVQLGGQVWAQAAGESGKSCADCHGHAAASMKGAATRYPATPPGGERPVELAGRINQCRTDQQNAAAWPAENRDLLALTAFVAHQSRGLPIAPPDDPRLAAVRAAGEAIYRQRQGQLNLSCAICHDDNPGRKLAGATIPQAHPTGYPVYRLEWQSLGSLRRRLRACLTGIRAEPWPADAPEYVALETYLMARARGMRLETPAVRP